MLDLRDFFEDPPSSNHFAPKAYIVTEILKGGELFDRIVQRTYYSEHEARKVIQILYVKLEETCVLGTNQKCRLDVMCHLHSKNIVCSFV